MRFLPRKRVVAAEIEELEGSLGAVAWGDVSIVFVMLVRGKLFFFSSTSDPSHFAGAPSGTVA